MLEDREWYGAEPASEEAIAALQEIAPARLPDGYLHLLAFSNGGEGPLPVQPLWLVLYPAEEVKKIARDGSFATYFPGLFVIGGNGGGEAIALDLRSQEPWPLVAFDTTNNNQAESVLPIASSFDEALGLIGRA